MKYNFDQLVNRKNTYSTQWDYIADRFGRDDILPFSISDTDFIIPKPVTTALKEAVKMEIFGYTRWNHDDFKNAICNYFKKHFNTSINPDWIVYSPSVMYSLSLLMSLLTNPNDYVATFSPMYPDFEDAIINHHLQPVRIKLNNNGGYYTIDFKAVEDAFKKCKVFLLCSPHNPTGRVWDKDELLKIIELAKKYDVKIISDEIHMDIVYHKTHYPIVSFLDQYSQLYLVSSGSKTYNYPSLGGSYAFISDPEIKNNFLTITKHRDFVNSANYMGMMALISSYNEANDYRQQLVAYLNENMNIIEEYINNNCSPLKFIKPEATYLAWIDCRQLPFTSKQLQHALVNIGKVGIMPGNTYFEDGYLRMCVGCSKDKLLEGLKRLKISIDYLNYNK